MNLTRMNRRQAITALAALATPNLLQAADWKVGQAAPNLSQYGLEGTLPSLKGKVVYLDFWASWCSPCKASFPVLDAWQKDLGPKGLVVLGVSVDETAAAMANFLKKTPVGFPVVRDAQQKLVAAANADTMPTSFIIDRKGVIRHVHAGFKKADAATLQQQIQALL